MSYFSNVTDLNELKRQFKILCMKHHPDRGGDTATMQEINAEYDQLTKRIIAGEPDDNYSDSSFWSSREEHSEIEQKVREAISKIIHLDGLDIEVIGVWVWVSGDTKPHKDALKSAGFKWNNTRLQWIFIGKKSNGRGVMTMDEMRAKYVSEHVASQKYSKPVLSTYSY